MAIISMQLAYITSLFKLLNLKLFLPGIDNPSTKLRRYGRSKEKFSIYLYKISKIVKHYGRNKEDLEKNKIKMYF